MQHKVAGQVHLHLDQKYTDLEAMFLKSLLQRRRFSERLYCYNI